MKKYVEGIIDRSQARINDMTWNEKRITTGASLAATAMGSILLATGTGGVGGQIAAGLLIVFGAPTAVMGSACLWTAKEYGESTQQDVGAGIA